ncbi:MAG: SDR family NAD(P)-dependent oxidoreductase [Candidatus Ozemobacteraceae bacterium]
MKLFLKGKKILITGGSKGLGKILVEEFLKEKAIVTYCSRSPIKEKGNGRLSESSATFVPVDALKKHSINACIETSAEKMGGLDVLINNVGGVSTFKNFWELTEKEWLEAFRLNFLATVSFTKLSVDFLRRSESPRIINISSVTAIKPGFFNPHYSASKAALINLTKHLAKILADDRILVNCVLPGTFFSENWDKYLSQLANDQKRPYEAIKVEEEMKASKNAPLKRMGNANEITPLILLLASPISSWQTGSCLTLDGGKLL